MAAVSGSDCLECRPSYLARRLDSTSSSTIFFSSLPFVFTCLVILVIAQRKLYPILAGSVQATAPKEQLPQFNMDSFRSGKSRPSLPTTQLLASYVFSLSTGLTAVLVELLLCEISNTLDPATRGLALNITLVLLLVLGVLITPALEIHGWVRAVFAASSSTTTTSTRRNRGANLRSLLTVVIFFTWLTVFWYLPQASILRRRLQGSEHDRLGDAAHSFTEACLERVGIIGISLMASLSGFAAVSSIWQRFGVKHPLLRNVDLSRKEAGLTATEEMLSAKESRLRALQRKMSETATSPDKPGFVGRLVGTIRGGTSETQELKALKMEISGLDTMRYQLSSSISNLRTRYAEQERSRTAAGKLWTLFNTIFAVYCAYRICATSLSSLRRWWQPDHSFATSDPINNILAILTTHWDSDLNREAWSRQISFLLSGVMLMASFSAALQTFRLFTRFAPGLSHHAQTSLPLIISQIAGTYVISSALLLRSNLPQEFGGVISDALGAPLQGDFVERWFESWFLITTGLTAVGILVGRKVGGHEDWDDLDVDFGLGGKRS